MEYYPHKMKKKQNKPKKMLLIKTFPRVPKEDKRNPLSLQFMRQEEKKNHQLIIGKGGEKR